jgi:hypothetical protein
VTVLSAKSCTLANCCSHSHKTQVILGVWSVSRLHEAQPLSGLLMPESRAVFMGGAHRGGTGQPRELSKVTFSLLGAEPICIDHF